jgi:hypothetical protein
MTARSRWPAVATAIVTLAIALPTAAEADTSPPAATPPQIPPVSLCSAPTPGTSPGSPGTPSGTTPTSIQPVPCIDASGNVYIVYVITTTTTTTPINAPIITANGPITWIPGSPTTYTVGASTTTSTTSFPEAGALTCTPIAGTASMVCSMLPLESGSGGIAGSTQLRLKCTVARATRARTAPPKAKSKGRAKRVTNEPTHSTKAARSSAQGQAHTPRRSPLRVTMLCGSV